MSNFLDDLEECWPAHHVRVGLHDDAALLKVHSCGEVIPRQQTALFDVNGWHDCTCKVGQMHLTTDLGSGGNIARAGMHAVRFAAMACASKRRSH